MYQGTTPTIPLTFKDIDLSNARIYLTIQDEKEKNQLTLVSGDDFTVEFDGHDTTGEIVLTQEQTFQLHAGRGTAQARFIFPDGTAGATGKANITIDTTLLKGVIAYDN